MGRRRTISWDKMSHQDRLAYMRRANRQSRQRRAAAKFQLKLQYGVPASKVCKDCKKELPNTVEYFREPVVRYRGQGRCKPCEVVRGRELTVRRVYGISLQEYNAMFVGALCSICGSNERLVLDHCHKTNRKRGVLCSDCNTAIGMMGDNPQRLRWAAEYLEVSK